VERDRLISMGAPFQRGEKMPTEEMVWVYPRGIKLQGARRTRSILHLKCVRKGVRVRSFAKTIRRLVRFPIEKKR